MLVPYHRTPPISEKLKTDGPFQGIIPITSTPFLGNFSQLTPYLGTTILGTPIPFILLYFPFFGLGKYVRIFTITLARGGGGGNLPQINNIHI